jgi:D-psicose/D-tagatose/L-ribulose 3-epimerase
MYLCADIGEPRGVKVALEPYNRDDANLLNTVEDATEFIKDVDRTHAQLMADFFHMKLNGESFDTLKEAAPHLIHAHIAEPGRGRPQTTPEDHAQFLQALRQYGYDGRVTLSGALAVYVNDGETCTALKQAIA